MASVGEIVRVEGEQYLAQHRATHEQRKALAVIGRCRTEALGLLRNVACERCGTQ